jgi:hypothetical protein
MVVTASPSSERNIKILKIKQLLQKYVTFSWDQLIMSFDEAKKLLKKHYGYGWTLKGILLT